MSDAVFFLVLFAIIVLFAGEPDLHDKLLEHFSTCTVKAQP